MSGRRFHAGIERAHRGRRPAAGSAGCGHAAAFDLFSDHGRPLPADFWPHSVTTAAAASAVARRVGALPNDAVSLTIDGCAAREDLTDFVR
jgi:hypothetical protein